MRAVAGQREDFVKGCYHVGDNVEWDFIWRIWWFDDKPKYRKIARLVDPSALRAYTQIADLRPSFFF